AIFLLELSDPASDIRIEPSNAAGEVEHDDLRAFGVTLGSVDRELREPHGRGRLTLTPARRNAKHELTKLSLSDFGFPRRVVPRCARVFLVRPLGLRPRFAERSAGNGELDRIEACHRGDIERLSIFAAERAVRRTLGNVDRPDERAVGRAHGDAAIEGGVDVSVSVDLHAVATAVASRISLVEKRAFAELARREGRPPEDLRCGVLGDVEARVVRRHEYAVWKR